MNIFKFTFFIGLHLCYLNCIYCKNKFGPDADLNTAEVIVKYGYPCETYQFKTKDNYLIAITRIPHGRNDTAKNPSNRVPVLLGHGLLGSAANWVLMGVEKSLGFRLADEGYDVWLISFRGTDNSRKHVYLNPDDMNNNFFDYSFHEIGYYDIPAAIDLILSKSNQKQVIYVGLSEGTTIYFAMASTVPKYNEKIKAAVLLAPSAYLSNPPSAIFHLLKENEQLIKFLGRSLNIKEIRIPNSLLNYLKNICADGSQYQTLCLTVYQVMSGSDMSQINKHWISAIISHASGASFKTLLHYLQAINTDHFRQFDYGPEKNKARYGQAIPPSYNLTLITSPLLLMYAPKDIFANKNDMKRLTKELPNVKKFKTVDFENFVHTDFAYCVDINKFVNNDIIEFVNNLTNNEI